MVARSLAKMPVKEKYHTVRPNETLSAIALRYNVSVAELVKWNDNIKNANEIQAGQRIVIGWATQYSDEIMKIMNLAGNTASAIAGLKYTRNIVGTNFGGFWRGVNQQYYSSAQAQRSSGRGWNFRANSMNIAENAKPFKALGRVGFVGGVATTAHSAYQFYQNPNLKDGADVVFGVAGLIYWPIGVAYVYYTVLVPIMWQSIREHYIEQARQVSKGNIGNAMMMSRTMRR